MRAERSVEEVRRLVLEALRGRKTRVWLFGSQARGDARPQSDIDVAILPLEELPAGTLERLRDTLEESSIPQRVDVVDLREVAEAMRARVEAEGLPWNE